MSCYSVHLVRYLAKYAIDLKGSGLAILAAYMTFIVTRAAAVLKFVAALPAGSTPPWSPPPVR